MCLKLKSINCFVRELLHLKWLFNFHFRFRFFLFFHQCSTSFSQFHFSSLPMIYHLSGMKHLITKLFISASKLLEMWRNVEFLCLRHAFQNCSANYRDGEKNGKESFTKEFSESSINSSFFFFLSLNSPSNSKKQNRSTDNIQPLVLRKKKFLLKFALKLCREKNYFLGCKASTKLTKSYVNLWLNEWKA